MSLTTLANSTLPIHAGRLRGLLDRTRQEEPGDQMIVLDESGWPSVAMLDESEMVREETHQYWEGEVSALRLAPSPKQVVIKVAQMVFADLVTGDDENMSTSSDLDVVALLRAETGQFHVEHQQCAENEPDDFGWTRNSGKIWREVKRFSDPDDAHP